MCLVVLRSRLRQPRGWYQCRMHSCQKDHGEPYCQSLPRDLYRDPSSFSKHRSCIDNGATRQASSLGEIRAAMLSHGGEYQPQLERDTMVEVNYHGRSSMLGSVGRTETVHLMLRRRSIRHTWTPGVPLVASLLLNAPHSLHPDCACPLIHSRCVH